MEYINQATKIAGVAIKAGQVVYYDETTELLLLTDADPAGSGDPAKLLKAVGVALNSCDAGQSCTYQYAGEITLGAANDKTYLASLIPEILIEKKDYGISITVYQYTFINHRQTVDWQRDFYTHDIEAVERFIAAFLEIEDGKYAVTKIGFDAP
jgi:hypothetical protein